MNQQQKPVPGTIYTREGKKYQVITLAYNTETEEEMVVYQELYGDFKIYASPLSNSENKEDIHPKFRQFLDAETTNERLSILKDMREILDDTMINSIAVVMDVTVKEGRLEDRYDDLLHCIQVKQQYELNRFR